MSKIKNMLSVAVSTAAATITLLAAVSSAAITGTNSVNGGLTQASTGIWAGSVDSGDIKIYRNVFKDSQYAEFLIDGYSGSITGHNGKEGNYKQMSIELTDRYGYTYRTSPYIDGKTSNPLKRSVSCSNDYIVSAEYYSLLYNGTSTSSEILTGYLIYENLI